jgi:hypothetical protein
VPPTPSPQAAVLSDVQVGNIGDAAEDFLDISMLSVTQFEGTVETEFVSTTEFTHELFGTFTNEAFMRYFGGLDYFVLADLDNNPKTGGAPADLGIPTAFQGAELVTA